MQMREDPQTANIIELNLDWSQLIKVVITSGLSQVPYAGQLLSGIVGVLWPKPNQPDTWNQIKGQVEALVNHRMEQEAWNRLSQKLTGLYRAYGAYMLAIESRSKKAIRGHWITLENSLRVETPAFQLSPYQVVLLPLFAQCATLHLSHLRDLSIHGVDWGMTQKYVDLMKSDMRQIHGEYRDYTTKTFEDAVKHREDITKPDYHTVQPFRSVNTLVRYLTLAALDSRDRWPDFFEGQKVVKPLAREIFTDPAGTTTGQSRSIPPKNRPPMATQPITRIKAWGYNNFDAIQVFYPPGGGPGGVTETPRMGTGGGAVEFDVGIEADNPIVKAAARAGDYIHQVQFWRKKGPQDRPDHNAGGRAQEGGAWTEYRCKHHIVSSVYATGIGQPGNPAAELIIFGFRDDTQPKTFTLEEWEFLYVHSMQDLSVREFLGEFAPAALLESTDLEALETSWSAARAAYWSEMEAFVTSVKERESLD